MPEGVPIGEWVLSTESIRGELALREAGCEMGLWSSAWRVGAAGRVGCAVEKLEQTVWIHFPLEMGAGAGQGVLEWGGDGVRFPLGAREGEWELQLERKVGSLSAEERTEWIERAAKGLSAEQAAWQAGVFRLLEGERLVGSLDFSAEPKVDLYDAFWTTDGSVEAVVAEEGPDLLLEFPVMPSLAGEGGVLRVNRPTRQVVVPLSATPIDGERRLRIEPGQVGVAERSSVVAAASLLARQREIDVVQPLVRELYEGIVEQGCTLKESMKEKTDLLLAGYTISTDKTSEGCRLDLEPNPPQHGRSAAFRVLPDTEPEWIFRLEP